MKKLKLFILKILNQIKNNPIFLILAIISYLVFYYLWGAVAALFLSAFVLFILYQWDSRIFIGFGLLFLISCPFYLLQRKELLAEEMAVYAYYFLFLGVMLQLIEYMREENCLGGIKKFLGRKK